MRAQAMGLDFRDSLHWKSQAQLLDQVSTITRGNRHPRLKTFQELVDLLHRVKGGRPVPFSYHLPLAHGHHFNGPGTNINAQDHHFMVSKKASTLVLSCSTSSME